MQTDPDGAFNGLTATIQLLEKAGKRVVFIIDNPTLPDPKSCMDRSVERYEPVRWIVDQARGKTWEERCSISLKQHLEVTKQYRALLQRVAAANPALVVFDPTSILCNVQAGLCPIAMRGKFLYSYGDHVSDYGSSLIAATLLPLLDRD